MRHLCLVLVAGCAFATTPSPPTAQDAVDGYRRFHRMNGKPRDVSERFNLLCRQPTREEIRKIDGPHAFTRINVFTNELAFDALSRATKAGDKTFVYPPGSVIVKEKVGSSGAVNGVGGMIKRKVSLPASVDDWEFFFAEKGAKPSTENLLSCKLCHAKLASRDFVFGLWQPPAEPLKR